MIWKTIKLLLSLICFAIAVILTLAALNEPYHFEVLGIASFCLFLATILWVDFTKPSRAHGLIAIFFGTVFLVIGITTFAGYGTYPRQCSGRKQGWCELDNLLYFVGGHPAVALPWLILAGFVFYGAIKLFKLFKQRDYF
jgi:hypothetical protein